RATPCSGRSWGCSARSSWSWSWPPWRSASRWSGRWSSSAGRSSSPAAWGGPSGPGPKSCWACPFPIRIFPPRASGGSGWWPGPPERAALATRVDELRARREQLFDVVEAERRRIERDLHDGAQQRLVALAMNLGMAKEKFDRDPAAARALMEEAHQDAKLAMV